MTLDIMYDAEVKGEMGFYIEAAKELLYPQWAHVKEDVLGNVYIEVHSKTFIHNDEFSMFVEFTKDGLFQSGSSQLLDFRINEETDQNVFKSDLVLKISQINKVHQALSEIKQPMV